MIPKGGKTEIEQRVNEVYNLLLSRANRTQILEYARKKWGEIGNSTVDVYINRARKLIQKDTSEDRKANLAEHIATRNQLYQIALKKNKLQTCLQILDSTAKIQGLYESLPRAIETVIDYGGTVDFSSDAPSKNDSEDGDNQGHNQVPLDTIVARATEIEPTIIPTAQRDLSILIPRETGDRIQEP